MLQLDNRTDWSATLYPGWGRDGKRRQILVFKVGYSFDGQGKLTPLPNPHIEEADRYRGEPRNSSLVAAGEIVAFKKGGELLLYGSAQPGDAGYSVLQVKVSLRQRNDAFWSKELRVFGPRTWQRKLLAVIPGPAQVIEQPVPLVYENSYGGTDPANPEETFSGNPAGVGFSVRGFRTKGLDLPQIECGPSFIASPASRVTPAGFGPLAPHWQPRSKDVVEIDEQAIAAGGCPWKNPPPESLFNAAPLDQRFDQPFEGELSVKLKGLIAETTQDVLINLPESKSLISFQGQGTIEVPAPQCDTLIIDADHRLICLVWRSALPINIESPVRGRLVLRDQMAEDAEAAQKQNTAENKPQEII
jgi:hypothetical protein